DSSCALLLAGVGGWLEVAPTAPDPLVSVRLNDRRAIRKDELFAGKLVGLLARNVLAHEFVDRGSQADIGDEGRIVAASLERPGFRGLEAGVRAVERIVLDVVLAVIAAGNGKLGSPGGFLGVREDGVD